MGILNWIKKFINEDHDEKENEKENKNKEFVQTRRDKYDPYESEDEKQFKKSPYYVKKVEHDYDSYQDDKNRTEPLTYTDYAFRMQRRSKKICLRIAEMKDDLPRRRSKSF